MSCRLLLFYLKTEAKLLARPHTFAIISRVSVYFDVCDSAKTAGFNGWITLAVTRLG